ATAGNGMKIGIIDDGLDRTHVFFAPGALAYPAGFPKGNTAYTSPKVIVARAFAPARPVWKNAKLPFDPQYSDHATNVSGPAGVVPVIAAGNDFAEAGRGSVGSPGTAPQAITVAASTEGDSGPADVIAGFSSSGPTPISLQMKPDVTAPGVDILSSLPGNQWSNHDWSGTSMASPHVAAAAALLKERHPSWTPAQVKSALESTGAPVHPAGSATELSPLREGGGRIDLVRADNPLVF